MVGKMAVGLADEMAVSLDSLRVGVKVVWKGIWLAAY
jgi:hypothetical protein